MFRKIHSNRDPEETILSQLKTEFAPYFEKTSKVITRKMQKRPRFLFTVMIVSLIISAGLSFTILRNKEPAHGGKIVKHPKVNVINDGFDQISSTAAAIRQTIHLKQQIDSLTAKKTLSRQDSATLEHDLDQLKP